MAYETRGVANSIIAKASADGKRVNHLKLQKLLYYACGYYLALKDSPLIDLTFEAWDYGPVVPGLFHELKKYGDSPIPVIEFEDFDGDKIPYKIPQDKDLDKVLNFVWNSYGNYSGFQLSDMTHKENSPWDKTRKANEGIKDADIPRSFIAEHFRPLVGK